MSDVLQNIGQQRAGLISLKRLMPMLTKKDFESAAAPPHKVRAGQWKDFISARRHIEASKEAGYTEVTGSLKKATDTAPKTLLDQAFEVRELPVKMTAAPVAPSTPAPSMVTARMPQSHSPVLVHLVTYFLGQTYVITAQIMVVIHTHTRKSPCQTRHIAFGSLIHS